MASISSGLKAAGLLRTESGMPILPMSWRMPADPQRLYVLRGQVHRPAQIDREIGNPSHMALRIGVLCLDGGCEREEDVLDAHEAVVQSLGPDEGAHPGGQLQPVRRFGDEVVRARLDGPDLGVSVAQGRDHDHRDSARRGVGLHPAACFEAVHSGHHRVEEDEVDVACRDRLEGLLAVADDDGIAVERLQHGLQDLRVHRLVVNDEDAKSAFEHRRPAEIGATDASPSMSLCMGEGPLRFADEPVLVEGLFGRGTPDADRKLPLKTSLHGGPEPAEDLLRIVGWPYRAGGRRTCRRGIWRRGPIRECPPG